ncbi:hypothetical protein LPB140_06565 [Sphingorhabdus lutea]|uniref:NADH dehydrogenase [ubiquinone] 1 alpha subcomplex assembly factor 3 n=1 Tax=Sphingorhabdus lutea TaxID=1913578 RepID=A0A1L3JBJ0_9SPHN|nr:Mth938-like domain-containing protein [Sphingorhabdus lutea]APG62505.1 hypothetical protein LPB140_06565 [Sphingorhabdus lutea]
MIELHRDDAPQGPFISHMGERGFCINKIWYSGGIWMTGDMACDWLPPALENLTLNDLQPLFDQLPHIEMLLLGTGQNLIWPNGTMRRAMRDIGIGLEVMDSKAAARSWSFLRAEGRLVAAALYPHGA